MKFLFIPILLFSLIMQGGGQSVNIPLQNPSLDQIPTGVYNIDDSCGHQWAGIPGWIGSDSQGTWTFQVAASNPCNIPLPADGSITTAAISNTMISQDTGVTASSLQKVSRNGLYTISFSVLNYFNVYPGYFEAKIYLAPVDALGNYDLSAPTSHELCSPDGWAMQSWEQVTYTCMSPQYLVFAQWPLENSAPPSDLNAHIIIAISQSRGWSSLLRKVALTFTPVN